MVFVEPTPSTVTALHSTLAGLGVEGRSRVLETAACTENAAQVPFFEVPRQGTGSGSVGNSLLREAVDETQQRWGGLAAQETRVRCTTPSKLLQEAGIGPGTLDVLVIDTEGMDLELVDLFLAIPGLAPVVVQFEWEK